ncbi:LrgB family protein [Uliginosibacterium sp. H3]|uniref:LrgB family protein n=1 Tax=Uliginosibacterium silvisoli TaxID=3114758 RepID=A0ABU6K3M2_9RHOO|nr:LrgB family protein [Uliginosibacterium sp. H3]
MNALLGNPALWLTLTIATYLFAAWIHQRSGHNTLTNPLLLSVAIIVPLLLLTDTSYDRYMESARFIHLLLAPATIALAVPLFANISHMRAMLKPLLIALLVGGTAGIVSVLLFGKLFGLPHDVLVSFSPKSVTTPIAMALAEKLGGNASLAAAAVLATGILGAVGAEHLFRWLNVRDDAVQGFAMGIASHGIGTTRALHISHKAGAFSGLGMSLNGIFTSLCLPALLAAWPL